MLLLIVIHIFKMVIIKFCRCFIRLRPCSKIRLLTRRHKELKSTIKQK